MPRRRGVSTAAVYSVGSARPDPGRSGTLQGAVEGGPQQVLERVELHRVRRAGLHVAAVERTGSEALLRVDELGDAGVDRLRGDDAPGGDGLVLSDAVHAVDGLRLLG